MLANWDQVHKKIPISQATAEEIIQDYLELYPELTEIAIVGTYARTNETPTEKLHDVDFLLQFPKLEKKAFDQIRMRNDYPTWEKWRKKSPVIIDVILRLGQNSQCGKQQERLQAKLPTPKIRIWKKPMPPNKAKPILHNWIDQRSLAMHLEMAQMIREKPELLNVAKANLKRWIKNHNPPSAALLEWDQILKNSTLENILKILTRWDEEARRLRQSSPFCGILPEKRRKDIFEEFRQKLG